MIPKYKKLIALALTFTLFISSNTALVSAVSLSSNSDKVIEISDKVIEVAEIKSMLEAAAIPIDPATILELLDALIAALGLAAALVVLKNITGDSTMTVEKAKERKIVPIYKFGAHTYRNLTPRPGKDLIGLSFTLHYPTTSEKFLVTSLNAVNSTGRLVAYQDNPNGHVTVKPSPLEPAGTYNNWLASRDTAETNPHSLSRLLYNLTTPLRN